LKRGVRQIDGRHSCQSLNSQSKCFAKWPALGGSTDQRGHGMRMANRAALPQPIGRRTADAFAEFVNNSLYCKGPAPGNSLVERTDERAGIMTGYGVTHFFPYPPSTHAEVNQPLWACGDLSQGGHWELVGGLNRTLRLKRNPILIIKVAMEVKLFGSVDGRQIEPFQRTKGVCLQALATSGTKAIRLLRITGNFDDPHRPFEFAGFANRFI